MFMVEEEGGRNDDQDVDDDSPKEKQFSAIVEYIIWLCSFNKDTVMVNCIWQEEWSELHHVTSLSMADIDQLYLLKNDGTWEAKPLKMHVRMLQAFLLYYKRMCREAERILDEHDVMSFIRSPFHEYMRSDDFMVDMVSGGLPPKPTPTVVTTSGFGLQGDLTAQEFSSWCEA